MKFIKNLVEYYDELFPVLEPQKALYSEFCSLYSKPLHFLRVCCGSGLFESYLARQGHDVTGLETCEELLRTANLRRRNQLMSIRFFQMHPADMVRFLGKHFYSVISILNSRILFLGGRQEISAFFSDCHKLLVPGGILVIQAVNFENREHEKMIQLPVKESMRARLFSEVVAVSRQERRISMNLETGSGKVMPVVKDLPVYPLLPCEIEEFAESAGFQSAEFYADYDKSEFTGTQDSFVVLLK